MDFDEERARLKAALERGEITPNQYKAVIRTAERHEARNALRDEREARVSNFIVAQDSNIQSTTYGFFLFLAAIVFNVLAIISSDLQNLAATDVAMLFIGFCWAFIGYRGSAESARRFIDRLSELDRRIAVLDREEAEQMLARLESRGD